MPLGPLQTELLGWAREAHPREACALVLERPAALLPLRNVSETPCVAFELDPLELLAALKTAGTRAMGIAHSHPSGNLEPSVSDLASRDALGGLSAWIVTARGQTVDWRAY